MEIWPFLNLLYNFTSTFLHTTYHPHRYTFHDLLCSLCWFILSKFLHLQRYRFHSHSSSSETNLRSIDHCYWKDRDLFLASFDCSFIPSTQIRFHISIWPIQMLCKRFTIPKEVFIEALFEVWSLIVQDILGFLYN